MLFSTGHAIEVFQFASLYNFKFDLKCVYMTKSRNESKICHLFSRRRHPHNLTSDFLLSVYRH